MRQKLVFMASGMLPRVQSDVFDGRRERVSPDIAGKSKSFCVVVSSDKMSEL